MPPTPILSRRILVALSRIPGRIVSMPELAAAVYADRHDGGPDTAGDVIRRTILKMRRAGVPIVTHGKRGRSLRAGA